MILTLFCDPSDLTENENENKTLSFYIYSSSTTLKTSSFLTSLSHSFVVFNNKEKGVEEGFNFMTS